MRNVALSVLLWASLVTIMWMDGGQSEATDFTNSTLPIDNTSILIEEEKEQDESNVTASTAISKGLRSECSSQECQTNP
jgi:hypothetical protein